MSQITDSVFYTQDHLWVLVEDSLATIGISDHGQHLLGDIMQVDLPEDDIDTAAGDQLASAQGRDEDLDFVAPVSGRVVEVNLELRETPELINQDPYGAGWLVRIDMTDDRELDGLMPAKDYEAFLERGEED